MKIIQQNPSYPVGANMSDYAPLRCVQFSFIVPDPDAYFVGQRVDNCGMMFKAVSREQVDQDGKMMWKFCFEPVG